MDPDRILSDKYRLVRRLDKGGKSAVWLAEHLTLAAPVVVKLIGSEVATTDEGQQRFQREARAASALRSPHVVELLDYGIDDGVPYIVMEFLDGESLADRLVRLTRLRPAEAISVIRHVSRAIARAHDIGIVHRDLKPTKIFITRNEDEEIAKVLDFGISVGRGATDAAGATIAKTTRTGTFLGTSSYVAPEQLQESTRGDFRVDIWAIGVVAFECLLGRAPFLGEGIGGLVLAICFDPLPIPSQVGEVPDGFDAWFARACARNPDERFASAREAAHELRCVLEPAYDPNVMGNSLRLNPDSSIAQSFLEVRRKMDTLPPSLALHSSTATASSSTIRGTHQRYGSGPALLFGLGLGIVTVLLLFRHLVDQPAATEGVVQQVQPLQATAGLRASGEGEGLLLTVDGKTYGPLPQELHDLTPGEHSVVITGGERYKPFRASVTLAPGFVTAIGPVSLEVAKGLAKIVPGEGAEGADVTVQVGDANVPVSPLPAQFDVDTSQPYALLARKKGYAPYARALTFEDGQAEKTFAVTLTELQGNGRGTKQHSRPQPRHSARAQETAAARASRPAPPRRATALAAVTPEPAPVAEPVPVAKPEPALAAKPAPVSKPMSTVTITSTPEAHVLLDGVPIGSTPLENLSIAAGSHRLIFIYGKSRKSRTIETEPGKHHDFSAEFIRSSL
jgi:serine/threonine protein kinase